MPALPLSVQPRLVDWSRLHIRLVWTYHGAPLRMHHTTTGEIPATMGWLLLQGNVEAEGPRSGPVRARQGQWLFLPQDKHRHDFSDDARILSVRLIARWPDGRPLYEHDRWITCDAADHPTLERRALALVRLMRPFLPPGEAASHVMQAPARLGDYLRIERATLHWLAAYDHVMQALGYARTPIAHIDDRVSQVLADLERLPLSEPFDEHAMARGLGLSTRHLDRLFTAQVGVTLSAYADQRRLDHARRALLGTPVPVKQLAYTLGFKQPSHFSNWFRKKTGVSPRAFRQTWHHPSDFVR